MASVKSPLVARSLALYVFLTLAGSAGFAQQPGAQKPGVPMESDLDSFMAKVLEKREIDWNRLHNYLFREREILELRGTGSAPIESWRREYMWLVRDGYLVRSPVSANGARVSEKERADEERKWTEERKKKKHNSLEREAFFGYRFQPGRYLLAGRKDFEGRQVVIVEHYPKLSDLNDDEDKAASEKPDKKRGRDAEKEDYYTRMFEKTLLVTMLIVPEEHQIVQMTFDNVGLDFLPWRWLVRVDEIKADMTMHQPFERIWLPRAIHAGGRVSTAGGLFSLRYSREFFDYQKTDVKVRFWYEKPKDEGKKP